MAGGGLVYGLPEDINRLLHTNDPRVDYQVDAIKNSLGVALDLKEKIALQITHMRMDLMRLEREELHATRHIKLCDFALAPVRRMPPEVLSHIFLQYVALLEEEDSNEPQITNIRNGVWVLTRICSYWRAVAITTPALWSTCRFRCGMKQKHTVDIVHEWLNRARTHPLSIRFESFTHLEDHVIRCSCCSVLEAFVARSTRWVELELRVPKQFYSLPVLEFLRNQLPSLKRLKIHALPSMHASDDDPVTWITIFDTAPSLKAVDLKAFSSWDLRMVLPWTQITSFSGELLAQYNILREAPNVTHCTFYRVYTSSTPPQSVPVVHNLQHLHLHAGSIRAGTLTLPALRSLIIPGNDNTILASVQSMLQSSMASSLTSLYIDQFTVNPEIMGVLTAAPSVTQLTIRAASMQSVSQTDWFFNAFVEHGDTPAILPALCTLDIKKLALGESFVRMLRGRCAPPTAEDASMEAEDHDHWQGARLESLTLSDVGNTHISHLLEIKKLGTEVGLKLRDEGLSGVRILG
ncbi:hypothetical protein R3P38DRAFT_2615565 [Favolaschia claudopus]|uniref:F-box domain-containing protein n=1 Tax=Favolaschia claudopus TaxID=2862362 RepID=A0AAW0CEK1_9AGAR